MQYFVSLKYLGRKAMSYHEFASFEEALSFSLPNVDKFNISIAAGEEEGERKEVVSFRKIK